MGPSWAGPENIRSSNILSTSATSMVTRNLKTLGIPLTRDFRPRFLDPAYASQKFRMSFRVDRNTRLFELLGRAPEHRPPLRRHFQRLHEVHSRAPLSGSPPPVRSGPPAHYSLSARILSARIRPGISRFHFTEDPRYGRQSVSFDHRTESGAEVVVHHRNLNAWPPAVQAGGRTPLRRRERTARCRTTGSRPACASGSLSSAGSRY